MNALTQIKNTQKATRAEIELGIGDKSSWHSRFKHSAYIYAGGLPFELTEGDILAVFSQYGEIVDIHLVRDKKTGKSRGFAFIAYEDQRSTVLAVDNLSGARVTGRTIRVEHVDNYRKKRAEVEGEPIPDDIGEEREEEDEEQRAARGTGIAEIERDADVNAQRIIKGEAGGEAAAWTGGNSMFELMAQAKAQGLVDRPWKDALANAGASGRAGDLKKDRKERKKEKKERRSKHRRNRSRSRSKSRSPRRREHRSRRIRSSRSRSREREKKKQQKK
jgi:RNA-binding motif X-linked protein 2